ARFLRRPPAGGSVSQSGAGELLPCRGGGAGRPVTGRGLLAAGGFENEQPLLKPPPPRAPYHWTRRAGRRPASPEGDGPCPSSRSIKTTPGRWPGAPRITARTHLRPPILAGLPACGSASPAPRRRRRDTPTHLADASTGSQERALFMPGGLVLKCSRGVPRRAPGGMPSPMPAYRAAVTRRSRTDIGKAGALIGGVGRPGAPACGRFGTATAAAPGAPP